MVTKTKTPPPSAPVPAPVSNKAAELIANALWSRHQLMEKLLDGNKDINAECGYPETISREQYRIMYDRNGVAKRVVHIEPQHGWKIDPDIFEVEDENVVTEFEQRWGELQTSMNLFHFLERVDILSGICHFGVLLLGIDDGKELSEPIDGLDKNGKPTGEPAQRKLLFLRAFDGSMVEPHAYETDKTSPRYGLPVAYSVQFTDWRTMEVATGAGIDTTSGIVHWHRIVHVADNRLSSEVFGVPRMKPVFNWLLDIRKTSGSSAEMFWKGGFPGVSFESNPNITDFQFGEPEKEAMKQQFDDYDAGLKRYLALVGFQAKSLSVQVADPTAHIDAQLKLIALTLGIPWRVFIGSEEAKLASETDSDEWTEQKKRRREKYLIPMVIRPFIDRLIAIGILPTPAATYTVRWEEGEQADPLKAADVALKKTQAMAAYIAGGVDALIPAKEYLVNVLGYTATQADAILKSAFDQIAGEDDPTDGDGGTDDSSTTTTEEPAAAAA